MRVEKTISVSTATLGERVGTIVLPRRLGPVKLVRELGRGGMGVVLLGRHELLDRDVAVKFLLDDAGSNRSVERFLAGARAASVVRHPNLTTIYHADTVNGIPYLVMEYVDGGTLAQVLRSTGPVDPGELLAVSEPVCAAVDELHRRDIIHGDLKPSNVLLDPTGRVLVTDFGLTAYRESRDADGAGAVGAGTPAYMAPEMFGGHASPRSDVFALGVFAFELLAGCLPCAGGHDEVRAAYERGSWSFELLERRGVSSEIVETIHRAGRPEALFRFKSAGHFLDSLRRSVGVECNAEAARRLEKRVLRILEGATTCPSAQDPEPGSTTESAYFERLTELADVRRRDSIGRAQIRPAEERPLPSESPGQNDGPRIAVSTPCGGCSYDLVHLRVDSVCPECGQPIAESIRADRLIFAEAKWVRRLIRGFGLAYIAPVIWLVAWIVFLAVRAPVSPRAPTALFVLQASVLLAEVLAVVAVFLCTATEGTRTESWSPILLRWIVRTGALACVVGFRSLSFLFTSLRLGGLPELPVLEVFMVCGAAGYVCGTTAFFAYLVPLARRIPERTLERWSKAAAIATPITVGMFVVTMIARLERWGEPYDMAVHLVMIIVCGVSFLQWSLLGRFRRSLRDVAKHLVRREALFGEPA